jgi:hypothetical protein
LRRLHNKEFHNLYALSNIVRVIKSRKMRWGPHVPQIEEMRNTYKIMVTKLERKRPLEDPCIDRKIMLECIYLSKEIGWD